MAPRKILFGVYEVDLDAGELRKHGTKVKLQEQPFQVLAALLERPGEIVFRDDLRKRLWTDADFGDFDHGLNVAIAKLRDALADSASQPRYIETVPRKGYRFIAPVSGPEPEPVNPSVAPEVQSVAARRFDWRIVIAGVVVLAAGAGAWYAKRPAGAPPSTVMATPVTSDPGQEQEPSLSPDGAHVAYLGDPAGQMDFDVYVRSVGSGSSRRVTQTPEAERNPAWSPDGSRIAFLRFGGNAVAKIVVVPAMGGPERIAGEVSVTRKHAFQLRRVMAWFPDGKRVVVVETRRMRSALTILDLESGSRTPLPDPDPGQGHADPAPSPDGRTLVYTSFTADATKLKLRDLASGSERVILAEERIISAPAWLSGGQLVFAAGAPHFRQLFVASVDGGTPRQIAVPGGFHTTWPSVAANRLVCHSGSFDVNLWWTPLRDGSAAGPAVQIAASNYIDHCPAYSPDGKRLAFISNRSGFQEVWVGGPRAENPVKLTDFRGREPIEPSWSPDGRRIAMATTAGSQVVDTEGGAASVIHPAAGVVGWLPSGGWVLFGPASGLARLRAPGAPLEPLGNVRGGVPRVDPSGRWVYFTRGVEDTTILRIPLQGGAEERLVDHVANNGAWTLSGSEVWFIPLAAPGTARSIAALNPETRVRRTVAPVSRLPMWGMTACPDGTCVVHAQADRFESDVMMIDGLP